jgi:hypothetical protein
MHYQKHKFTIPRDTLVSEEYSLYESHFSISVTDDLIGLFKSFNISVYPSDLVQMVFEYDVCLIKSEFYLIILVDNNNIREKEHEDKGLIKQHHDQVATIKSAFHVEESQFRDNEYVQVMLSIRPKNYAEFSKFQQSKIEALETRVEYMEIKSNVKGDRYEEIDNQSEEEEKVET